MDARTQEEFQALRRENDLLREENHTLQEALDRATAEIGTWKRRLDQKKISDALHGPPSIHSIIGGGKRGSQVLSLFFPP